MQPGHTVTGPPPRRPAHAARPGPGAGLGWLLAALVAVFAAAATLLAGERPTTSTPPSARTITVAPPALTSQPGNRPPAP